jgi:hypothetical protein
MVPASIGWIHQQQSGFIIFQHDEVYGELGDTGYFSEETAMIREVHIPLRSRKRSPRQVVSFNIRMSYTDQQLQQQLRAKSISGKTHPLDDPQYQ